MKKLLAIAALCVSLFSGHAEPVVIGPDIIVSWTTTPNERYYVLMSSDFQHWRTIWYDIPYGSFEIAVIPQNPQLFFRVFTMGGIEVFPLQVQFLPARIVDIPGVKIQRNSRRTRYAST